MNNNRWRNFKDRLATRVISVMGIGIIVSVILIMLFLVSVVLPMFTPASVDAHHPLTLKADQEVVYFSSDEYQTHVLQLESNGMVSMYNIASNTLTDSGELPLELEGRKILQVQALNGLSGEVVLLLDDNSVYVMQLQLQKVYVGDGFHFALKMALPMGEEALELGLEAEVGIVQVTARQTEEQFALLFLDRNQDVHWSIFDKQESLLDEGVVLEVSDTSMVARKQADLLNFHINSQLNKFYLVQKTGVVDYFQVEDEPSKIQSVNTLSAGSTAITASNMLLGDISLMLGYDNGIISQWFPVNDEQFNSKLTFIRQFDQQSAPIIALYAEHNRKGFYAIDTAGNLGIYHATAHNNLWLDRLIGDDGGATLVPAEHGDKFVLIDKNLSAKQFLVDNEYPEISMYSLWQKVWYENYREPDYVWQSSSSNNDFEPKFSLTPLVFGTLKATFYGMLFAIPMGILGAIYTAFFMAAALRSWVKPTVEIMAALPTVIIGFIAGLWLAPIVEQNLPGIFLTFLLLPIATLVFGYVWYQLPKKIKSKVGEGWRLVVLTPLMVLCIWLGFQLSAPVEAVFFAGNMPNWLTSHGVDFDQRNSLVIGIALGIAIVPTIFSISEDAIYSVPKHLVNGSLALGASNWQTLIGVVLPTASPGIYSSIMMGLGRGVGETMIVLMATGNTPTIDINVFEGLRSLSANISVEMPEAEHNSSHYRILFLSGLVLFIFTFCFNAVAEHIRQRMLKKYGGL